MRRWLRSCVVGCLLGAGIVAAQTAEDKPVRVSAGVMAGRLLSNRGPIYPEAAKAAGIQGTVVLVVTVMKSGLVGDMQVVSGPEELRDAARDAVSTWIYKPIEINGQRVAATTNVRVDFLLPPQPASAEVGTGGTAGKGTSAGSALNPTASAPAKTEAVIPSQSGPVRASGGVMAGYIIEKVNPVYPKKAKNAHISGVVVMHAIISKTGDVSNVTVVSGPDLLREASLTAVRQWKYRPYLLNGNPVEVDTMITMAYHFSERPAGEREKSGLVQ